MRNIFIQIKVIKNGESVLNYEVYEAYESTNSINVTL
jgi:hypothetical protein